MTQCWYVDTALNAILDINKMKDDKVSAKTGPALIRGDRIVFPQSSAIDRNGSKDRQRLRALRKICNSARHKKSPRFGVP
jgi:hypothetical protein